MKFKESDFSDEEFIMLKAIFAAADAAVQAKRINNYDTYDSNILFNLIVKLGIDDIVY